MDGRALVVAGNDDTTLNAVESIIGLNFTVGAGPTAGFELFDADRDATNWDTLFNCGAGCPGSGAAAPELFIELFADPAGTGGIGPALATWTPGAVPSGTELGPFPATNNAWTGVTFTHDASALNPVTNNYQYALHLQPVNAAVDMGWNAFKVRAAGAVILLGNQVVGFIGAMNVPGDLSTIYPDFPAMTPTAYDGTWSFQTRLPPFLNDVTIFDGDMDFGAANCAYNDTDDPDSSGIPPFGLGSAAVDEGVAVAHDSAPCAPPGVGIRTSTPAEDNPGAAFRRVPTIVPSGIAYQLKAPPSPANPGGQIFLNQNPSGNREWEQFKIQLVDDGSDIPNGACPAAGYPEDLIKGYPASDCRTTDLPGGVWEIQVDGMDLANLNFWFFGFKVEPIVTEYSIGRLVWYDANENGAQDLCGGVPCAPELGIAGVAYTVYDGPLPGASVIRTGFTDANGEFLETGLSGANYTVVIDASNFAASAPLEGMTSTTGGETQSGVEVGLPECIDTHNPPGCGEPAYAEAIFGYVAPSGVGLISPTNTSCQQYASGTAPTQNTMLYSLQQGANVIANSVAPGVIFFFTKVTVGTGQTLSVAQSHTGFAPLFGVFGAKVYTTGCKTVSASFTYDVPTGLLTYGPLPAGTYIVEVKLSGKSLSGKPAPNPSTSYYTFVALLNAVPEPGTQNQTPLALQKR
jgi:hypothetical protein